MGRFSIQEGRGDEALRLVWSDNSEAAHRWLATTGEVAVSAEYSSKEAAVEWCEGEAKWGWPPLVMCRRTHQEASPRVASMTGSHRAERLSAR
jgi:hypothetical protein